MMSLISTLPINKFNYCLKLSKDSYLFTNIITEISHVSKITSEDIEILAIDGCMYSLQYNTVNIERIFITGSKFSEELGDNNNYQYLLDYGDGGVNDYKCTRNFNPIAFDKIINRIVEIYSKFGFKKDDIISTFVEDYTKSNILSPWYKEKDKRLSIYTSIVMDYTKNKERIHTITRMDDVIFKY